MNSEGYIRVHQSAWLSQCHDPAKKSEILDKAVKTVFQLRGDKGNPKPQIHGNAAQLEWKIPPVVTAVIFYIIDKKLFVCFCQRQYQAA